MDKVFSFKVYPLTLAANAVARLPVTGSYFRIQSATGAVDVTVEGVGTLPDLLGGQAFKDLDFNGLIIQDKSGAPNTLQILVASAEFQDNRLQGTVDLSAASLAALEITNTRPEAPTGFYSALTALAANTPDVVFTPASNTNGVILLTAGIQTQETPGHSAVFLHKASAPNTVVDGSVVLTSETRVATTIALTAANLPTPQFIPPGQGLYFIANQAMTVNSYQMRSARWRAL